MYVKNEEEQAEVARLRATGEHEEVVARAITASMVEEARGELDEKELVS